MELAGSCAAVSLGLAVGLGVYGCGWIDSADDCALNPILRCGPFAPGSSTGSSGTGGSTPGCDPASSNGPVADSCGVFVSSSKGSDTTGKGTKEVPYQSLGKALASAGGKAVYACGESFTESVTVSTKVTLYGALVCSQDWSYDSTQKTKLAAAADAIPLTLASTAGGTALHDFAVAAADAMKAGGSSIAVLAQANVMLQNVDVMAGKGADGAAGAKQTAVTTPATADGKPGIDDPMCNAPGEFGGAGGANMCGSSTDTSGGSGGAGQAATSGGDGSRGNPIMTPTNAGSGQTMTMSCTPGGPGAAGSKGTAGTGARGIGEVSASGYVSPAGTLAMPGGPGQGGGGGGGARQCASTFAGPSGGGGGAGGCGGAAGLPGQSGGSSIGILALGATPSLSNVSIATHDGGAGGVGGDGQLGGPGGQPGKAPMMTAACDGGPGGQGGAGGPGGGGAGGHSIAIAVKGAASPDLSSMKITLGKGAAGGPGGDMDVTMQTKGDGGLACKTLDFTNPMSPTACVM
jgi:hypothetical protein